MNDNKQDVPTAVQLYTLRHYSTDFAELIRTVAGLGCQAVELINDHGLDAETARSILREHDVQAVSAHVPFAALQNDLDAVIAFQRAVGNRHIILPSPPREVRQATDAATYRAFGKTLDAIGRRCVGAGVRLGYHNHYGEMAESEGKRLIDWLLESAEPDHLFWEPDLAWIAHGGADPVALLERYAGRCPRVHAKDLAPEGENADEMGLADVGYGILDWEALLPAVRQAGAEWLIIEHDLPQDPVASVRRSLDFLSDQV